jgi:ABC-type multidrug transport system ATPase subunit
LSPPDISLSGVVHKFADVVALNGVDFEVRGPGCFGFLGVNGAGKTTMMRLLNGFIKPTAGTVRGIAKRNLQPGAAPTPGRLSGDS